MNAGRPGRPGARAGPLPGGVVAQARRLSRGDRAGTGPGRRHVHRRARRVLGGGPRRARRRRAPGRWSRCCCCTATWPTGTSWRASARRCRSARPAPTSLRWRPAGPPRRDQTDRPAGTGKRGTCRGSRRPQRRLRRKLPVDATAARYQHYDGLLGRAADGSGLMTRPGRAMTDQAADAAIDAACRMLRLPTVRARFTDWPTPPAASS